MNADWKKRHLCRLQVHISQSLLTKRFCFSCVCGKCILRAEAIDLLSKHIWQTEILKKIEKSSQTFWNTETYPSCKPQNNGRKCDILNNKPEFLFYRPSIYRHRYHSTKKYVTKQIGLSKLNAILILSFEWKLILKAETLKLIWHNWALF